MAIGADGRLPERAGYSDRGARELREFLALLIVEADASAVFDHKPAAVAADRGLAARHQLGDLTVMRRIGSIVVVDENPGLAAVRALIDDEMTVRTDGRRTIGKTPARSGDGLGSAGLPVEQVDRPVGIVG